MRLSSPAAFRSLATTLERSPPANHRSVAADPPHHAGRHGSKTRDLALALRRNRSRSRWHHHSQDHTTQDRRLTRDGNFRATGPSRERGDGSSRLRLALITPV